MATQSQIEKTFDKMIRKNPEKKAIPMPTIDGHFWIVRDGKIVDWDFPEFAEMRRTWNCGKEKNYIPAPVMTQKIMTQMFKKAFSSSLESDDWDENMEEFKFWNKFANMPDVRYSCCFQNCILEIHERGGELIFGSLGFKKNKGQGYHYEWGGENYNTVADFLKLTNACEMALGAISLNPTVRIEMFKGNKIERKKGTVLTKMLKPSVSAMVTDFRKGPNEGETEQQFSKRLVELGMTKINFDE